jgi:hypothetical protein
VMDLAQLRTWMLANFTEHPHPAGRSMFRLETLDAYEVASDGNDYGRYLRGEPEPDQERKGAWLRNLEAENSRGLRRSRVHVLETPLRDPYLRYEVEWGYLPNVAAGEDVRILDLSEANLTAEERDLLLAVGDYWMLNDGEQVVLMRYDNGGQFVGAELVEDPAPFVQATETAWQHAEPVESWWARHPEEHRSNHWAA